MAARADDVAGTLRRWHQQMAPEVRWVFDSAKAYDKILQTVENLSKHPQDLDIVAEHQRGYAQQLNQLAGHLNGMTDRVSDWQGPARQAFDKTVAVLTERVQDLADLGVEGSEILATAQSGRDAGDGLILDLVKTSIDFAVSSLEVARNLSAFTNGLSMSTWASVNIRQVMRLVDEVTKAGERVGSLLGHLTAMLTELTSATTEISNEMGTLRTRLAGQ